VLDWSGSRRRLLGLAFSGALLPRLARAAPQRAPLVSDVGIVNLAPYLGDSASLATLSPLAGRTSARLRFRLARPATVTLETLVTGQGVDSERTATVAAVELATRRLSLPSGWHALDWSPDPSLPPRTYILRLQAGPLGGGPPYSGAAAVVRLLGVDAGFLARSAAPGETARLVVRTDAETLGLRVIRCGPERDPTYANDQLNGEPVDAGATLDWRQYRDKSASIPLGVGDWPSGLYAVRIDAKDGRIGFAPLVVRPRAPTHRVAVVLPTSTWQAYNFYDSDGDGWGDTWYARWRTAAIDLSRPHANRGVPYRFRSYDLGFLHWLHGSGKKADVYADEDLERFPTPEVLRAAYDLLVFPGHTEYVTARAYDLVEGFRDRGGNLAFLSANNFFRQVERFGQMLRLVDEWRDLGRPEASLCGVQYVASDRGERHAPFVVTGADAAPWAFRDMNLRNGDEFGLYGIEIDARAPSSPPQTQVLATIQDLFGPGRSAEMTYYEHASGARVFSAGVLNFGGQLPIWPEARQLLENVWTRLAPPVDTSGA
jgi:N,N-dimethylformamidase beta subunit-like, C-terminal